MEIDNNRIFNKYLINSIKNNKLSHAYLFYGQSSDAINIEIYSFVKTLFCDNSTNNYNFCDNCKVCKNINNNNYLDFYILEQEGNIKKEDILKIKQEANLKSIYGRKIYWIKNVDKLTQQAANSLLKVLEEPEDNIIIILSTENKSMVLNTIISRCQTINIFSNFRDDLEIKNSTEKERILNIVNKYITDCKINMNISSLNLIEQLTTKEDINYFFDILLENYKNNTNVLELNIKNYTQIYSNILESKIFLNSNVSPILVLESFLAKLILEKQQLILS